MALTSNDETDLLLPLYQGVLNTPRFGLFLDRLRKRTRAAHVSIATHRAGAPFRNADVSFAGVNLTDPERDDSGIPRFAGAKSVQSKLRPYRVYSLAELSELGEAFWRPEDIGARGIVDMRVVRIGGAAHFGGVLSLARSGPCKASDSALLSNLAPYVETALSMLHAMERERFEAMLSAEGLVRSGTGWILFDADARLVAIEPATQRRLAEATGVEPRLGERLHSAEAEAERRLAETASLFAKDRNRPPGSAIIWSDPRIDTVLVPIRNQPADGVGHAPDAVMIAYCRFETVGTIQRTAQLAGLFDLPTREAELAIALADGHSIAEAATSMGLTLETARNYSKRLYAQLGVRGQTGLVRLIHRSSAVLA